MTAPDADEPPARRDDVADHSLERRFTIGELAEAASTPVRRIRYYQSQGLLDPPRLVGRTGFYGNDHLQRLWTIASLRHRGIETAAIRELLERAPLDPSTALRQWLDASEPEATTGELVPQELTAAELTAKLQGLPADTLDRLIAAGLVEVVEETEPPRYLVSVVACDVAIDLERTTGVPVHVTADAGRVIARHAQELATELGDYALAQLADPNVQAVDLRQSQQALIDAATRVSTLWLRHHLHETARARIRQLEAEGGAEPPTA